MISVIILTCDSHLTKNFCLRHCLQSIVNQRFDRYEIIILDNGCHIFPQSEDYVKNLQKKHPNCIQVIKMGSTVPRGIARNIGANHAIGETLLFMDEDVILLETDVFSRLETFANTSNWGCGAQRLWTFGNWFNTHAEQVLVDLENRSYEELQVNSGDPPKFIRGSEDILIETRSMIGHFGFCAKNIFMEIGGFEDLPEAQSFDDDLLNLKLYLHCGPPKIYNEIQIIHINHGIYGSRTFDNQFYFEYLIKAGIYNFDSEHLIFAKSADMIIEYLKPVHFNEILLDSHLTYLQMLPLNAQEMNEEELLFWRQNMQIELEEFCRITHKLINSSYLDEFIKNNYGDFDNIAPLIQSLLNNNVIEISDQGKINGLINFKPVSIESGTPIKKASINPKSAYNQFPCDEISIEKRKKLFQERYPYCSYLRIGIIGDDDLLAQHLKNETWIGGVVLEKDSRILELYKKNKNNFDCVEIDLLEANTETFKQKLNKIPRIHTFITDPPYTLSGALLFLYTGISMVAFNGEEREFYLILNPMIIGKPIQKLLKILAQANIFLKEIRPNLSTYPLPASFMEHKRAHQFANINDFTAPLYSSSSNLYIFTSCNPNLEVIREQISEKLIYKHYQL